MSYGLSYKRTGMGDCMVQSWILEIASRVRENSSKKVTSELNPEERIGFKELKTGTPDREYTSQREPEAMATPQRRAMPAGGHRWATVQRMSWLAHNTAEQLTSDAPGTSLLASMASMRGLAAAGKFQKC